MKYLQLNELQERARLGTWFHYKRNWLKTFLGFGTMGLSFVIPDVGIGMMVGLSLMSPISLRKNLKNKFEDTKDFMVRQYYKRF